ncbi:MAG: porin family protein [Gammaproteobacteria bacterium]|nr:porin family protein [Gammaproteobacteria bacterium]
MKHLTLWTLAWGCLWSASAAVAQDGLINPNDERLRLSAGVFAADSRTELRLDSDAGTLGTLVNAEQDLGLRDHSDAGDVEVELRVRDRHRIRFNYFKLDRNASQALSRQIRFGDDVYNVNDVVTSAIDMRNFGVTYSYEFLRFERYELGASFGVNLVELDATAAVAARNIREQESRTGPTPTVGVHTLFRITKRIHAELRAEYMQLHIDDFEGTVTNLRGALIYRFNDSLGVGLGYALLETEVESEQLQDTGRFSIANDGALLFVRVAF